MNIEKLLYLAVGAKVVMTIALIAFTISLYTNEQETPLSDGRFIAKNCLFQRTLQQMSKPWAFQFKDYNKNEE